MVSVSVRAVGHTDPTENMVFACQCSSRTRHFNVSIVSRRLHFYVPSWDYYFYIIVCLLMDSVYKQNGVGQCVNT